MRVFQLLPCGRTTSWLSMGAGQHRRLGAPRRMPTSSMSTHRKTRTMNSTPTSRTWKIKHDGHLLPIRSRRPVSPCRNSLYARLTMAWEGLTWPDAADGLVAELRRPKGRLALVVGEHGGVDDVVRRFEYDTDLACVRLGAALADLTALPTSTDIETALEHAQLLCDIELLLSPDLGVSPLAFPATCSPPPAALISVWPGHIKSGRATYSDARRPRPLRRTVSGRHRAAASQQFVS